MAYDIFISYRRDGGEYTAKILRDRLQDAGYRAFFDVESLRSGDFNTKLYSVIDECTDFLLVLSPGALDRCKNEDDWVRREVEYALEKGKNVIPVMLRGFAFPDVLPPSLEPLRFQNGLEANTQLFDAFVQKLEKDFLKTKPTLWHKVQQNTLLRRTLPLFLALALLLGAAFGVKAWIDHRNATYPFTTAEESLTEELIYYITRNLTSIDLSGDAAAHAIDVAQRYFSSGEGDRAAVEDRLEVYRRTVEGIDLTYSEPSAGFMDRMAGTPFPMDDIEGLHTCVALFQTECISYLDHIQWLISPDCHMTVENKLETLECQRVILDETLRTYAYSCNELLLPVTNEKALARFWYQNIPEFLILPLDSSGWETSEEVLESKIAQSNNRIETAMLELSQLVGNTNMDNLEMAAENDAMREAILENYMAQGMTREEAQSILDLVMELRQSCLPRPEDDVNLLWEKMTYLLRYAFFDDAQDCADAYWALTMENPDAQQYIPALNAFIDHCRTNGVTYGVMVMAYVEEDGINEQLQRGDVIVSFNGEPCVSYEDYAQKRGSAQENAYTVEVLRRNASGTMDLVPLELSLDMPRVYLNTVVCPD